MIKLGDKVKDSITGFTGVATGRTVYYNGCISVLVTSNKLSSDGNEVNEWFDEQRLDNKSEAKAGGPQNRPPTMHP